MKKVERIRFMQKYIFEECKRFPAIDNSKNDWMEIDAVEGGIRFFLCTSRGSEIRISDENVKAIIKCLQEFYEE